MIYDNPLFSKDSFKKAAHRLGEDSRILVYDGSDDGSNVDKQKKAGRELQQGLWILATVMDYIFDYYPFSYWIAKEDNSRSESFIKWFIENPAVGIKNAISYAQTNFPLLDTVRRDKWNQHRIPSRHPDEERHAVEVLVEIQNNLSEIMDLFNKPRKISDPKKPSAEEIKSLITAIKRIQDVHSKYYYEKNDIMRGLEVYNFFEVFLNPLYMAWQVYNYGWHSDFWKEGDSMWSYMSFEMNVEKTVNQLIEILSTNSSFEGLESEKKITTGLLKVYKHLLTQDWRDKI